MCRNVVESCIGRSSIAAPSTAFSRRATGIRTTAAALEDLAALRAGEDAQLLAVFGYGAARDLDVLVVEELDDALIGVRVLRALRQDDLLDLQLDRLGGQVVSVGPRDPGIEEILQLVDPLGRVDVLVGRHARDRGFVHADVLGDVSQDERLEVRGPLVEELALKLQD